MTNQIKCPGCGWTLEFDPAINKFACIYCNKAYSLDELLGRPAENVTPEPAEAEPEATNAKDFAAKPVKSIVRDRMNMPEEGIKKVRGKIPMNVQICRSCGAELVMKNVEASSFCAFCGQATIASERLEDWLEPDTIIPFKVTKSEAEDIIRKRLQKGRFVPEGIKKFETDRLRGIYIPYWLFDVYCADEQGWFYSAGRSSAYSYRLADCKFKNLTVEASKSLNDDYSAKLEPFDTSKRIPFNEAYLSGFYSDRFDLNDEEAESFGRIKAVKLFDSKVRETIPGKAKVLEHTSLKPDIMREEYSMLPVWFMTFRHEDTPYTILVNGQTGKMVGAVPYVKKKARTLFAVLAALLCPLFAVAFSVLNYFVWISLQGAGTDAFKTVFGYIAILLLLLGGTWIAAITKYDRMEECIGQTCSTKINSFVKERQDK